MSEVIGVGVSTKLRAIHKGLKFSKGAGFSPSRVSKVNGLNQLLDTLYSVFVVMPYTKDDHGFCVG